MSSDAGIARARSTIRRSGMMRTRGFTLLEIMIALGVLAVVLGLSLPALSARLDRGSFDAASQRVVGAIRQVRDQARASGKAAECRVRTLDSGVVVLEWAAGAADTQDAESERSWALLCELPGGLGIERDEPDPAFDREVASAESPLGEDGQAAERVSPIAAFLPSGEAIVASPVWLVARAGDEQGQPERWSRIQISPWSGRVTLERGDPGGGSEQEPGLEQDDGWGASDVLEGGAP